MFRRVSFFILTNIAILAMVTVMVRVTGLDKAIAANGYFSFSYLLLCAIIGMSGAFISLFISKWMVKRATQCKIITEPNNEEERWLMDTIAKYAQAANIRMPEVGISPSQSINALATGATRNKALLVFNVGLLRNMSRDEVEGVIGHEIAHVQNGDMITLTLLQGILNTFVIFIARIVTELVVNMLSRGHGEGSRGSMNIMVYFAINMALQVAFGLIASIVIFYFSRKREFRADAGSAKLHGSADKMLSSLKALQRTIENNAEEKDLPENLATSGINNSKKKRKTMLFSTHPSLEDRIAHLEKEWGMRA